MSLKRILIAGEGGQGIQSLAHILTSAAYNQGKKVTFLPNFGVEQRGGVSLAYIQVSDDEISFPKFEKADFLVLFADRAIKRIEQYLKKETVILFDNSLIPEKSLEHLKFEKIAIPASYEAKERLTPRVFNIIMLGALVAEISDLKPKQVIIEIEKFFSDKIKAEPELKHLNLKAFDTGFNITKEVTGRLKWQKKILKK